MPRKKSDTTPWFNDEKRIDSVFAKMVYYNEWGSNYVVRMKDSPQTQRMVKCQECGLIIPRDVPRLSREGSWYRHGHLCMDCGEKELSGFVEKMEFLKRRIIEHIALGKALKECATEVSKDQRYIDKLAMGKMLQVMRRGKQQ